MKLINNLNSTFGSLRQFRAPILCRQSLSLSTLRSSAVKMENYPLQRLVYYRSARYYSNKNDEEANSGKDNVKNTQENSSSSKDESQKSDQTDSNNGNSEGRRKIYGMSFTGPVSYTSLGLTLVASIAILIFYNMEKERLEPGKDARTGSVNHIGKPALGGPWVLVNHEGKPVTDASYRGKYVILYFGFTFCPDICPNELVKVGKILSLAKSRKINADIKPIFISVDPNRDTVGQLRAYKADFHPDMDFLTGTPDQIAAATRAYRVYFSKANENAEDESDYLVDHSIVLYFLSPDGEFLDFFTQRMQVKDIVDKMEQHMKARGQ